MERSILVIVAISLATVACSALSVQPATPTSSPSPMSPSPSASASVPASPLATAVPELMSVRVYFMLDGVQGSAGIVPVLRDVSATPAVATAAMQALLAGPDTRELAASPAISTEIPNGTRLVDLSIDDRIATVDLSAAFATDGLSQSHIARLAQVVYTLTQFPTIRQVALLVDGRPIGALGNDGVRLDGPVGRSDLVDVEPFQSMFEGVLPSIFVDAPAWGSTLDNPVRITGTANTYEAWLLVGLADASGRTLVETPVSATCGTGCRGTFDLTLAYAVEVAQWGTLRVLDGDESGATTGIARDYPVWLTN